MSFGGGGGSGRTDGGGVKGEPRKCSEVPHTIKNPSLEDILDISRQRSASLNNLEQYAKPNDSSPKTAHRQTSLLSASPLKGLKKKLSAFRSKSNCDISNISNENKNQPSYNDASKLLPYHNSVVDGRSPRNNRKNGAKDEMKKKKNSADNNNIIGGVLHDGGDHTAVAHHNGAADHHQRISLPTASGYATTPTPTPRERTRSLQDSTDQYIVVDAEEYPEDNNSISETDEVDGCQAPEEYTDKEIERLLQKIERTRSELIKMQATKDENVKEYLKSVDGSSETSGNKTKLNFEKNNQKTNTSIQLLQKKLEKYNSQLKELEERGIQGHKRIMRVVQDSVRSGASSITGAVSKPLGSLNNFIKKDKKETSYDNVHITVNSQPTYDEDSERAYMNSDEDSSICSNQLTSSGHQGGGDTDTGAENDSSPRRSNILAIQNDKISRLTNENEELRNCVRKLEEDLQKVMTTIHEEQYKSEQLHNEVGEMYSQWNDLTELHQNEMTGLKEEVDQTLERIECTEYRFSERSGDIEEAVDNCVTRITKMELQQQQQQQLLLSFDGYFDGGGNARILISKLLSLVVSIFAILLVLVSTLTKIVMPFASTRARIISTSVALVCIFLVWKNSENGLFIVFDIAWQLARPIYNRLPQWWNDANNGGDGGGGVIELESDAGNGMT